MASVVIGAAGSFAAISTLLGSPITGAFLLMEVAGLAGPMLGIVLTPGLVAAGSRLAHLRRSRQLDRASGRSGSPCRTSHRSVRPTSPSSSGRIGIGVVARHCWGRSSAGCALYSAPIVGRRRLLLTPVVGLVVAGLAIAYGEATGKSSSQVLFSGQEALTPADPERRQLHGGGDGAARSSCKSLAYAVSLSAFRGGPIFPSMFIGAALGIALSHLPGLPTHRRRRDGDRGHERGDAETAAHLRPARDAPAPSPTASR